MIFFKVLNDQWTGELMLTKETFVSTVFAMYNEHNRMLTADVESITGESTYLDMLHSIAGFYRKYLPGNAESNLWAGFIESLDQEKWDNLLENMPTEIELAEPVNLGNKLVELKQLEIL